MTTTRDRHVLIRVDASRNMGIGHVMRCLSLADALKERGFGTCFVGSGMPDNFINLFAQKGHTWKALISNQHVKHVGDLAHSAWLTTSQETDAQNTLALVSGQTWDWLIVDHYALDYRWEQALKPFCDKILVIDDLADRAHYADILLDQTYSRLAINYAELVPANTVLLCGAQYALLRPEFAQLRSQSLQKRRTASLRQILISMGGSDLSNASVRILDILKTNQVLDKDVSIVVVMGALAPSLAEVQALASTMPWDTKVVTNAKNMAQLMYESDLAIGAAGASSWERCVLGLPTILLTLAENQKLISKNLQNAGAVIHVDFAMPDFNLQLDKAIRQFTDKTFLQTMSEQAAIICDGLGVARVLEAMHA